MSTITCLRCGNLRNPLGQAPLSGRRGEVILASTCAECWSEWREESLKIINHYGLQPADPEHRAKLYDFMRQFLHLTGE